MSTDKGAPLPVAERQRLLDWLYRERLFRPLPASGDKRRPCATAGKERGSS